MNTETGAVRVINDSKCRRELLVDTQTYVDADGKFLRDINGGLVQPKIESVMLEQGANIVDAGFLAKCRAVRKEIEFLFSKRILTIKPVLEPKIDVKDLKLDEDGKADPESVRDLSELKITAASKVIAACNDHNLLRKWVDEDPRQDVRKMLRERFAQIVPHEETGVDPLVSDS